MKKRSLVLLTILVLCVSLAFAAGGTKTFQFGPTTYTISEYAPDFINYPYEMLGARLISGPPDLCVIDVIEGRSPDETIFVSAIRLRENGLIYLVVVVVADIQQKGTIDVYEDLGLIQTGKPSFLLTKTDKPSDLEPFIAAKEKQHKKTSGGKNSLLFKL